MPVPPAAGRQLIAALARLTRRCHPRGTERLLRLLYDPDRDRPAYAEAVIPYGEGMRIRAHTRSFIGWRLFFFGAYEPHLGEVFRARLRPGEQAIDVGANIGCHTLTMAQAVGNAGRVLAFEPNPIAAAALADNIALNGLSQVRLAAAAAGAAPGRLTLHRFADGERETGTSSLHAANVTRYLGAGSRVVAREVAVETIDGAVAAHGLDRLRLIKIDTEGHEVAVLMGARETLVAQHPAVVFEYAAESWRAAGYDWAAAARLFAECGYQLALIGPRGPVSFDPADPPEGEFLATA